MWNVGERIGLSRNQRFALVVAGIGLVVLGAALGSGALIFTVFGFLLIVAA